MNQKEKRQLETELLKMGLAGLQPDGQESPELVQQIAAIVNHWKAAPNRHGEWIDRHKFLRDLFAECDTAHRNEMYTAIVPHLNFPALPLERYVAMMTERMDRLVSKKAARLEGKAPHPIEIGGKKYAQTSESAASHAMATLHCQRCWRKARFVADTPAGAMIAARKAGWARMPDKETCPNCVKKLMVEKVMVN